MTESGQAARAISMPGDTCRAGEDNRSRVAVIGGGLAGIAAALRCADTGAHVTLYEARPRLGGLTNSFWRDLPEDSGLHAGIWVDNGQHVFLRCCTAYRQLLQRLETEHLTRIQPRLDIPVRGMLGPPARQRLRSVRLRASRFRGRQRERLHTQEPVPATSLPKSWPRRPGLPAPYHLAGALLSYPWLTAADRARLPRVIRALRRLDPTDAEVDSQSFGGWLSGLGQSRAAVDCLWDLIGVATLNAHADQVALSLAATVFQTGLLFDPAAADIGIPMVPLGRLHGEAATDQLQQAGADVRTRTKAMQVTGNGSGWRVSAQGGAAADDHDAVIIATPPRVSERLLPAGVLDQSSGWSEQLGNSPIINLHLLLDRCVLDEPFLAAVGSDVQWIFDRTTASGTNRLSAAAPVGQYLAVSLSAADNLVDLRVAELRARFLPELIRLLPRLAGAELIDFFVTRERQATFRPAPGSAAVRPPVSTAAPTLALAGAWTQTRWPATMEGAVRSGHSAAAVITESLRQPCQQGASV